MLTLKRLFSNKQFAALVALVILTLAAYQNCARVKFDTNNTNREVGVCENPTRDCETETGYGSEVCNDSENGPVYGACIPERCKPGFTYDASTRTCKPNTCNPGDTIDCPVDNGTGVRRCVDGQYSPTCDVSCNPGFYFDPTSQNCRNEFVRVNGDERHMIRGGAIVSSPYTFAVSKSPNLTIGTEVSKVVIKNGQCPASRAGTSEISPFIDGPLANRAYQEGDNNWLYTQALSRQMAGCRWEAMVTANRTGLTHPKEAFIEFEAKCTMNDVGTETCPTGERSICIDQNNDSIGDFYRCEQSPCPSPGSLNSNGRCICPGGVPATYNGTQWTCGGGGPVNGACLAPNPQVIANGASLPSSFCSAGTPVGAPTSIPAGGTATYTCNSTTGGSNSPTCTISRCTAGQAPNAAGTACEPVGGGSCTVTPPSPTAPLPPNSISVGATTTRWGLKPFANITSCGSRCSSINQTCNSNGQILAFPPTPAPGYIFGDSPTCMSGTTCAETFAYAGAQYGNPYCKFPAGQQCGGTTHLRFQRCIKTTTLTVNGVVARTFQTDITSYDECNANISGGIPREQNTGTACSAACITSCSVSVGGVPLAGVSVPVGQSHTRYVYSASTGVCGTRCGPQTLTCNTAGSVLSFAAGTYADQVACQNANPCTDTCLVRVGGVVVGNPVPAGSYTRYKYQGPTVKCSVRCALEETRICTPPSPIDFTAKFDYTSQPSCEAANPCTSTLTPVYGDCQQNSGATCSANGQLAGSQSMIECRMNVTSGGVTTTRIVPISECVDAGFANPRTCSLACNPTTYAWETGAWGLCSGGICGTTDSGTQSRTVICRATTAGVTTTVADSNCTEPKPDMTQACTAVLPNCECRAGTHPGVLGGQLACVPTSTTTTTAHCTPNPPIPATPNFTPGTCMTTTQFNYFNDWATRSCQQLGVLTVAHLLSYQHEGCSPTTRYNSVCCTGLTQAACDSRCN